MVSCDALTTVTVSNIYFFPVRLLVEPPLLGIFQKILVLVTRSEEENHMFLSHKNNCQGGKNIQSFTSRRTT